MTLLRTKVFLKYNEVINKKYVFMLHFYLLVSVTITTTYFAY